MKKKIIEYLLPPPKWRFSVLLMFGVMFGLLLVIFRVSNAVSYLSDSPETCVNCHVMTSEYVTWQRSSHSKVATCNDCHVPHDNFLKKYLFKASDGMRHATIFTLRAEPEVIKIKEAGIKVVQENCIRCHGKFLHSGTLLKADASKALEGKEKLCWECHRETPHGRVHSLSSTPYATIPQPTPVFPEWISNQTQQKSK